MAIFISGLALFVAAFLIHIIVWRIRVPARQLLTLMHVFLWTFVAGIAAIVILQLNGKLAEPISLAGLLLIAMFYGGLCVTYLIFFTALEADSPSLTMINLISAGADRGITIEKLRARAIANSFVEARIEQMLQDGMAVQSGDRLYMGPSGGLLSSIVLFYRHLLGHSAAGG